MPDLDLPILVCYAQRSTWPEEAGGDVKRAGKREYGKADLTRYVRPAVRGHQRRVCRVDGVDSDSVTQLLQGYEVIAETADTPVAAIENCRRGATACSFTRKWCTRPRAGRFWATS